MVRKQLSTLTYSELAELAARLSKAAETVRNPLVRADLLQQRVPCRISRPSNWPSKNSPHIPAKWLSRCSDSLAERAEGMSASACGSHASKGSSFPRQTKPVSTKDSAVFTGCHPIGITHWRAQSGADALYAKKEKSARPKPRREGSTCAVDVMPSYYDNQTTAQASSRGRAV
jgi:hypothetical protein